MSLGIRKEDTVIVIAGKDKGKIGKVLKVIPENGRLVVEKVNIVKRHRKAKSQNEPAGIFEFEAPIDKSNVMLYSEKAKKGVRISTKVAKDGSKVRYSKKTEENFG